MKRKVEIEFVSETADFLRDMGEIVDAGKAVYGVYDKVTGVINRFQTRVSQGLIAGGASIGAYMTHSTVAAVGFEREMLNLESIMQMSNHQFAETGESVLQMVNDVNKGAADLAKGAYEVASSGFTRPSEATAIIEQAGYAASAGLTSTDIAARALVVTLNAYSLGADQAARVSDVLFQTVNAGQVNFEQLAIQLGDFVGFAQAAGVELEEIFGTYAFGTKMLGQPAQAATATTAAMRGLLAPTEDMIRAYDKLGVATGDQAIEQWGLQGTIRKVAGTVGNQADAVQKLFGNVEALRIVLPLVAQDQEDLNEFMSAFTDETALAGSTMRAFETQQQGVGAQWDQFKNSAGAFGIMLAQGVLPPLTLFLETINDLLGFLLDLPAPLKTVVGLMLGLSSAALITAGTIGLLSVKFKLLISLYRILSGSSALGFLSKYALQAGQLALRLGAVSNAVGIIRTRLVAMGIAGQGAFAAVAAGAAGAVGAMVLVAMNAQRIHNMVRDFKNPPQIDKLADTLTRLGEAAPGTPTEGIRKDLEEFGRLDATSLRNQAENIADSVLSPFINWEGGENTDWSTRLEDIDTALASMVANGYVDEADKAVSRLSETFLQMPKSEVLRYLDDYNGAVGDAEAESKHLDKQMAELERQMYSGAEAASKYRDRLQGIAKAANEATGLGSLIKDLESGWKSQADAADDQADAVDKIVDAEMKRLDAAEAIAEAEQGITDAIEDRIKAQKEANLDAERAEKKLRRLRYISGGTVVAGSDLDLDIRETELDLADAHDKVKDADRRVADARDKLTDANKRALEATKDLTAAEEENATKAADRTATLADVLGELDKKNAAFVKFNENLAALALKGIDPAFLAELRGMGSEGVAWADMLIKAGPEELDKAKAAIKEHARITSEEFAREMDLQLVAAAAVAKVGVGAEITGIINEMERIAPGIAATVPEVKAAMDALGLALMGPPEGFGGAWDYIRNAPAESIFPNLPYDPNTGRNYGQQPRSAFTGPPAAVPMGPPAPGEYVQPRTKNVDLNSLARTGSLKAAVPSGSMTGMSTTNHYQFGDLKVQDVDDAMRQARQKKRLMALGGSNRRG